tara:strand:- start:22 stop:888 length:867 start_codon:yes stop_codon:yes gene_type:complete
MGYTKKCIYCQNSFEAHHHSTKSCSEDCRRQHKNFRRKKSHKNLEKTYKCRFCGEDFKRYKKRNGFCSRACASKKYIQDGTYDAWRLKILPKRGKNVECVVCKQQFYESAKKSEKRKFCSRECMWKDNSERFAGKGNPFYGKTHTQESKQKQKDTLLSRYGVINGYEMAKHKTSSKSQIEILKQLRKQFPKWKIQKEKRIGKYRVDILIPERKTIIEYNGSYWHCDPRQYSASYYNKKKGLLAEQIWEYDKKRINKLKSLGYTIIIVWERDYLSDKEKTINSLIMELR